MGLTVIICLVLILVSVCRFKGKVYFKYLPYIAVFLFMALRFDYGDGKAYRIMYTTINSGTKLKNIEPLYILLNKLLPSFGLVIIITSAIYIFAFWLIISNTLTCSQRTFAFFIWALHPYILMVDMSAIRQSLAIAAIMCGIYASNKYKTIYFFPFCILAAMFHRSAIILLPLFFIFPKHHFTAKTKIAIFAGTVASLFLPEQLIKIVTYILDRTKLSSNYVAYVNNGNKNGILAVILSLIILAFFLLCGDVVADKDAIYVKLSIFACVLEATQGSIQQLGRISMYFFPFWVISLPLILQQKPQRLQIKIAGKVSILNKYGCWLVQGCFILVFIIKLRGFMTPQFAYRTIFSIG